MKPLAVVFLREVEERRLLLLMALLLGLVPLVLSLVPGLAAGHPSDLRQAAALGLALVVSLALAVLLGASGIAGDLMAGRMGFYFSRPLPAWAIWGGKLAAMLALVGAASFLVLLPTLLVEGFTASNLFRPGRGLELVPVVGSLVPLALVLLFALLGSHFLAVAIRSRSPWLALDVAALTIAGALVGSVWRSCVNEGLLAAATTRTAAASEVSLLGYMASSYVLAFVLALAVASAVQVSAGRLDARRGHRLQSLVLWSLVALASAGLFAVSRWAVAATPQNLTAAGWVRPSPRGPWLAVHGPVRSRPGFFSTLLVNLDSGRFVRTRAGVSMLGAPEIQFTPDGRLAYWFEPQEGPTSPVELKILDLTDPRALPRATGSVFEIRPIEGLFTALLSPDGRRLAVVDGRRLVVEELASRSLLAAREIEGDPFQDRILRFEGRDRLRIEVPNQYRYIRPMVLRGGFADQVYGTEGGLRVRAYTVDLRSGGVREAARIEAGPPRPGWWEGSPEGDRGVVLRRDSLEVYDSGTGSLLSTLAGRMELFRFVPGGLAVVQRDDDGKGRSLLLFDRDGRQVRARLALPGMGLVALSEGTPGEGWQVMARPKGAYEALGQTTPWKRWRMDLAAGSFEPLPDLRLHLLASGSPWDPEAVRAADGVAAFEAWGAPVRIYLRSEGFGRFR